MIMSYPDLVTERNTPKVADSSPVRPKSTRPLRRQTSISQFFTSRKDDSPTKAASLANQHASSDEFNPDMDTSAILEDINMIDVPPVVTPSKATANPFRITLPPLESADEEFQTPPTSPLLAKSRDAGRGIPVEQMQWLEIPKDEAYFHQKYDLVRLPEPSVSGRKRSFPEPIKPPEPRKVSRDGMDDQYPRHYVVNNMSPIMTPITREEERPSFPGFFGDNKKPLPHKQDLHLSVDSIASTTTSTATASPAWRSPNVSFNSNSTTTSFTSSADGSDLTEAFTNKPPLQRRSYMNLQRSISAYATNENDKTMAPPTYPAREPIEQYLAAHLFSETPFGNLSFRVHS